MGNYPVSYPHPDIYNTQYCILVATVVSQKILNEAGSYIIQKKTDIDKNIYKPPILHILLIITIILNHN